MIRPILTLLLLTLTCTHAAPFTPEERAKMLAGFGAEVVELDAAIAKAPSTALYSRRGDRLLFLGKFPAAVADFEKMIALDPTLDAPHWRLGIAYYFQGDFAKCSAQFAKYHAYDSRDRENGIWKFLADVKLVGIEEARKRMLPYTQFDREPFPGLYEMFAGKKTGEEVLAGAAKAEPGGDGPVTFFAHYYVGINEGLSEHKARTLELLGKAVDSPWGRTAEGGPAYMWQAARLHREQLEKK